MELIKSMAHPNEVIALLKYKLCDATHLQTPRPRSTNLNKCYAFLNATSRSFSAVIQALDDDLRDAICIFYLVLRSLDTIEDDMSIEHGQKVQLLKTFHTNLTDPVWNFTKSHEKDKIVLEEFPAISAEFRALKPVFRKVISEICEKMGSGMSVYLTSSPDTLQQWDEYCHYVAGLVGIGLSEIFSASGLEDASVGRDTWRSNSMGLFLQKTNIIRDYLEDVQQGRLFWPAQVWKKYSSELIDLSRSEKRMDAVHCLNELITNALRHIPDVIEYLSKIENQSVFNFCAIPQVMAIATLERCYNNPRVFTGVVKIRKGEAVHLMQRATNLDNVKAIFAHFVNKIKVRIPAEDPSAFETFENVVSALRVCDTSHVYISNKQYLPIYMSIALILFALLWHHWTAILASGQL